MRRSGLIDTLSDALEDTSADHPRRITSLEIPLGLEEVMKRRWLKRLRPAGVLVAIREQTNPTVVFTVRSQNLRAHGGQISFPGGRMDEGDDFPVGTALREAQEEIDLPPESVRVIGYLDDYPTISKYRVTPVVGLIGPDVKVNSDSGEVAEVFEVPLSFLLERDNFRRKRFFARMGGVFYELHYKHYRIWGATAGMLFNMQQIFEKHALD
ncbi:MAG: CoA pyrophosphatase [Oceanococcus sp.]